MGDFLGKNDKEAENVSFSALTHRVKFQLEICNFTNWLFEPCGKYISHWGMTQLFVFEWNFVESEILCAKIQLFCIL